VPSKEPDPKPTYCIWKYRLKIQDEPQSIEMPHGSGTALSVQYQHGRLVLWAIVDPDEKRMVRRTFQLFGTGQELPENWNHYIGTVQQYGGHSVLHVFQLTDYLSEGNGDGR